MKSVGLLVLILIFSAPALCGNLHLIDSKPSTGFAIYRTGKPNKSDMKQLCDLGITEMLVLSGDAETAELKYASVCPGLKVVSNINQSARVPLTKTFINEFESWVNEAQVLGKKIAFRCTCGCHRTGRLAAYYQMKYQSLTPAEAIVIMKQLGMFMWAYPELSNQVYALDDYIKNQPCGQDIDYCVQDNKFKELYVSGEKISFL